MGPALDFSDEIHQQKYRHPSETFRESMNRIAGALQDSNDHFHAFRDIIGAQRFLPGGRVQNAMGSPRRTTAYNCFVSGTIEDSFTQGEGNIMERAAEAASTMRLGGGIGYDFSTLRPSGAPIRSLGSKSSGPIAFMGIFDAVCKCVASAGHRRGAQMGILRVDHPDVEEFIRAKNDIHTLTGFNISLAVTDEFMEAVAGNKPFDLRWGGEVYQTIDAAALWEQIMHSTWDWAEPGVIFIDRINGMNNLWYCETIAATNPCGEQPLPPYGACLLGSFNLTKYMHPKTVRAVGDVAWSFDWDQFRHDIPHVVRSMDNVVDRTIYPLPAQELEAKNKRRMGLGITGLANTAEALGMAYGSPAFLRFEQEVLSTLRRESYRASALLAKEKGAFPLFAPDQYLKSQFLINTFGVEGDDETLALIAKYGIRNSHLTSIAPTGTISLSADNVSSGIEPVFSHSIKRTVNMEGGQRVEVIDDYGVRVFGHKGKTADEVTVDEHVQTLIAASRQVDSAVSKTCNVPANTEWGDFKNIYVKAWEGGAKGCTTFNVGGKRMGIMVAQPQPSVEEPEATCRLDLETGRRECG